MKKLLILVVAGIMCALTLFSCSSTADDPIELVKMYDEKDYYVEIVVDEEDIEDIADEVEIRSKGIYCFISVESNDYGLEKGGIFIWCNDNASAKKTAEDLEEYNDANPGDDLGEGFTRFTIERKGNLVFLGSEYAWEELQ